MLIFNMIPVARRIGCEAEVAAYTGPFVGWRFLGAVLQEIPPEPADTQAVIGPVIAGMDRLDRGEDWPEARAAANAAAWAAGAAEAAAWAAANAAAWAAAWWSARTAAGAAWAAARAAAWAAARAAARAAEAAVWAEHAGVPYARQREILLKLMEAPHAKP